MKGKFISSVVTPLLWTILSTVSTTLSTSPIIQTNKGFVRGKRLTVHHGKHVDAFYGIPYAKPPVGELRFRHPLPADEWPDVFDATHLPKSCIYLNDSTFPNFKGAQMWNPNTPVDEDCLYLNVWVPRSNPPFQNKAVMIWIYGGSFSFGSSALDVYNAKYLAAENDIIVVSMQYRLGSLGFLSFGDSEAPGNAGLFDQLAAIEWVQTNIHNFGGNSHNVTLFGESVGSASVGIHMLSPLSRGKFQRAILQSGAPQATWATVTKKEAFRRSTELAKAFNCFQKDVKMTLKCLREKEGSQFPMKDFNRTIAEGINQFPFVAVIDGVLIPESPKMAFNNLHFKKTPILIGTNINEGNYFLVYEKPNYFPHNVSDSLNLSRSQFLHCVHHLFKYYPQYPKELNSFGEEAIKFQYTPWKNPYDQKLNALSVDQAFGDMNFVCPTIDFADRYALAGVPVYQYRFEHRSTAHFWPKWMGVLHGDEINFVFGEPLDPTKNYTHIEKKFSKKLMKYWTNFAKTGDPNKEQVDGEIMMLDEWPVYTIEERKYLRLTTNIVHDHEQRNTIGIGPKIQDCAFWNEYLPNLVKETADTSEVEREWKVKFADWSDHFDNFLLAYEHRLQSCNNVP